MTLSSGTRLGSYEVLAPIGKGGMGEVWKARDTKLGRDVALKILPAAFASDPDRMARFEREARVLASLDHPNIAAIYGLEESDGVRALVLALIDGPTLADRIEAGSIPLDEAIQIARQIAEAVEYAHDRGVIHRDLKPANIKITSGGMVKVLDFGLAKALDDEPVAGSGTNSPTLTMNATRAGVLLGTAAYMSPEQAKGKQADRRSDIWSFGAVLYEMVTGKPPFSGESVGEVIAAVIKDEPKLDAVPAELHGLVARCLNKDPRQRLQAIGEARITLENPRRLTKAPAKDAPESRPLAWMLATGALALVLVIVSFIHFRQTAGAAPRMHLSIALPENAPPGYFALSSDGRMLVMATANGLAIRAIDSAELRPLTGTRAARDPFWSPDGRNIAFFAEGKLKVVPASGGPAQTLCNDTGIGEGGTWSRSGAIVFATETRVLYRVTAAGGTCTQLIKPDPRVSRSSPVFLPDGDHFLYLLQAPDETRTGLYIASLTNPNGARLLPDISSAVFAPDTAGSSHGHLLFSREQKLMAQTFDAKSFQLSGDPFALAQQVSFTLTPSNVAASASGDGTVVYLANARPDRQLVWYDHAGKELGRAANTGFDGGAVSLAPDGKQVFYVRRDAQNRRMEWLEDLERSTEAPFLSALNPTNAVWSPDGQHIAYTGGSGNAIYVRGASGGKEEVLLSGSDPVRPSDWSRDGRWLIYTEVDPKTGADIWMLPVSLNATPLGKPAPLIRTPFGESQGQISPDGRWLAYTSNESGTGTRVYVQRFDGAVPLLDTKWQISTGSRGTEPRWRADGKELFFIEPVNPSRLKLMAVSIGTGTNPAGTPKPLFEFTAGLFVPQLNWFSYSPSADGQRFLINAFSAEAQPTLDVLLNWQAALKK